MKRSKKKARSTKKSSQKSSEGGNTFMIQTLKGDEVQKKSTIKVSDQSKEET